MNAGGTDIDTGSGAVTGWRTAAIACRAVEAVLDAIHPVKSAGAGDRPGARAVQADKHRVATARTVFPGMNIYIEFAGSGEVDFVVVTFPGRIIDVGTIRCATATGYEITGTGMPRPR